MVCKKEINEQQVRNVNFNDNNFYLNDPEGIFYPEKFKIMSFVYAYLQQRPSIIIYLSISLLAR